MKWGEAGWVLLPWTPPTSLGTFVQVGVVRAVCVHVSINVCMCVWEGCFSSGGSGESTGAAVGR